MTSPPDPQTVYNNAQAGQADDATPGVNAVVNAWAAVQDYSGNWAVTTYNTIQNLTSQLQGVNQ